MDAKSSAAVIERVGDAAGLLGVGASGGYGVPRVPFHDGALFQGDSAGAKGKEGEDGGELHFSGFEFGCFMRAPG